MIPIEQAFATWVVRHRWLVIAAWLVVIAAAGGGLRYLTFNNNHRLYFSPENPQLQAFNTLERTFVKNDTVMFIVAPADGRVFSRETLALVKSLTTRAWQLPYSNRVDSLTNFQFTEGFDDNLVVRDLVPDPATLSDAELAKVKAIALAEPLLRNMLIRDDARVTAVNVVVQMPRQNEAREVPEVANAARAVAAEFEHTYPGLKIYLTGVVMMDHAFAEAALQDAAGLIPLSFAVMVILLGILIGGVSGTLATVAVVGCATLIAMGVGCYVGYPVSTATSAAPLIILTVAIANCVHLLHAFVHGMRDGLDKPTAIVTVVSTNLRPIFMASLTTVIGFLTFNFSDVPPFRQLGNLVAFGDFSSYLLSISFFPALLAVLPVRITPRAAHSNSITPRLAHYVIRWRRQLLLGFSVVMIGLFAGLPRNELNDVFVKYFDNTVEFRRATDFTVAHLTGVYHLYYTLSATAAGGVSEPAFMQEAADFVAWLRTQPAVVHVASYTDIMRRLNKNLHGDDPTYFRLPGDRDLAAQYLLLYEMSLPYGLDLNNQINIDKSSVKIGAGIQTLSSQAVIALNTAAEAWLKDHAPHIKSGTGSGSALMFAYLGRRNITSMLKGTIVALLLISVVLLIMLRSVKLGFVSLIPNLVPLGMGFGLWGYCVGQIGLSMSVVSSMTLGVIIDDTVHFLVKYQRAKALPGNDAAAAVRVAYQESAPAMMITSVILIAGFLTLALSHFQLSASMGLLTAAVIAFALLADLLFLAPVLLLFERYQNA